MPHRRPHSRTLLLACLGVPAAAVTRIRRVPPTPPTFKRRELLSALGLSGCAATSVTLAPLTQDLLQQHRAAIVLAVNVERDLLR